MRLLTETLRHFPITLWNESQASVWSSEQTCLLTDSLGKCLLRAFGVPGPEPGAVVVMEAGRPPPRLGSASAERPPPPAAR